jgi:aspartyl-tRNA(Asn)/glutamyl-tRNA(Gln) amidotransferase subunit C
MPRHLSREAVDRIARLAHLALTDEEAELFARQLAEILEYAEQLKGLDTSGVEPTAHVLGRLPTDRADEIVPSLDRRDALTNAPDVSPDKAFFRVPRVIG